MSTRLVMGPVGQHMGFGKRGQEEGAMECGDTIDQTPSYKQTVLCLHVPLELSPLAPQAGTCETNESL